MLHASAGLADPSENHDTPFGVRPRLPDVIEIARAHAAAGLASFAPVDDEVIEEDADTDAQGIPASFLDALPQDDDTGRSSEGDYISAVNSDEAGLYRMFLTVSP